MAEIKKISTEFQLLDKFLDTSGDAGSANQVLVSTTTGVNWVDGSGSGIIGGPYLPLAGGTLTSTTSPILILNPTANNYGGIQFNYAGAVKGLAMFNSGAMYYGGEAGINTIIQAGGVAAIYVNTSTRNVGINVTVPNQKLHVSDGGIRVEKFATGLGGFISIGNATEAAGNYSAYFFGNTASDTGYFKGGIAYETLSSTYGRGDMHFLQNSTTSGGNVSISDSVMTILNGGNVGIGTTSPLVKLQVYGNPMPAAADAASVEDMLTLYRNGSSTVWAGGASLSLGRYSAGGSSPKSRLDFKLKAAAGSNTALPELTVMTMNSDGRVGIGTTSPTAKLNVKASGSTVDQIAVTHSGNTVEIAQLGQSANGNSAGALLLKTNGGTDTIYLDAAGTSYINGGNVGIGTTSPGEKLHVVGNAFLSANSAFKASYNNTDSYHGSMRWAGLQLGNNGVNKIVAGRTVAGGSFQFWTNNTNDAANYTVTADGIMTMAMTNAGNVGIGVTGPSEKLVVDGKVIINNTNPPNNLAQLNIGYTGAAETRAIDIDGGWSGGESKSITFSYGSTSANMVGQISCSLISSTDTRLRFGKLYYNGDSSAYTMELKSTSLTTADLTVAGTVTATNFIGGNGAYLPLAGGTMTGNITLPGEENNTFKIGFTGASATSGLSTVDQNGAGLYIGANSKLNNSGVVVYNNSALPSSGIYFDGWNGDDMEFYTGASGSPTKRLTISSTGNATFTGLVSGITPTAAANFVTKAYADALTPGAGVFLPLTGGTMSGNTIHNDNVKSIYGTASDGLEIYHDGTDSIIADTGTGNLYIRGAASIRLQGINQSNFLIASQGGNLNLYYNNANKFNTSNTGVNITGEIALNDKALLSNQENTDIDTGAEVVAQVSTSTYTAAFFDFVVKKGTNVRSGTVYACHDGTNVEFTETSTNDLGDTSDVTLSVDISGTNMRLLATVTSDDWSVKSLIRAI